MPIQINVDPADTVPLYTAAEIDAKLANFYSKKEVDDKLAALIQPPPTPTPPTPPTPTPTPPEPTPTPPTPTPPTPPPTTAITNLPSQPCGFVYAGTPGSTTTSYAKPGGLVIAGRGGQDHANFKQVSSGGGHVLIYLDAMIDNKTGRYHDKLINASEFGAAVPRWPGGPQANSYGYLNDIRVGSVLHTKLPKVLELMVTENPHMAGWFMDDVGSRSWFPNLNWGSFSAADKTAYRNGAIEICKTVRAVANKYRLMFIVNGTWSANDGGGYPSASAHGCSLADGGCVEHHALDPFWQGYCSPNAQWAKESATTSGKAFHIIISSNNSERDAWKNANVAAYLTTQTDYGQAPAPWTTFHPTGLPSKVT